MKEIAIRLSDKSPPKENRRELATKITPGLGACDGGDGFGWISANPSVRSNLRPIFSQELFSMLG
jgi:hypothetical protein